jgi:hypothetical protein
MLLLEIFQSIKLRLLIACWKAESCTQRKQILELYVSKSYFYSSISPSIIDTAARTFLPLVKLQECNEREGGKKIDDLSLNEWFTNKHH